MATTQVFDSNDALAEELVGATELAAREAIAARGVFSLALTGGSAASSLYPALALADVEWSRVHVYFGDERCVPPDHADSNYKLARDAFLSKVPLVLANVHRMLGELDRVEAAECYERELPEGGVIDVVHLGLGPDGHVCSLFPDHPLLDERARLVASLDDSPKPPPSRITLTLPALERARSVWFLALGASKADAVASAIGDPSSRISAAIVERTTNARWFLDRPAASKLAEH